MSLQNQRVLITGGGSGLGEGMARYLASKGAHVIICSRNIAKLEKVVKSIQDDGGSASALELNLRDYDQIQEVIKNVMQEPLYALINNAAANFVARTQDLSKNGFNSIFETVASGTFFVTQAVGKNWIEQKSPGRVVSITATYSGSAGPHVVPSAMGKAAVASMTRSLAVEWGGFGIRLNAIAPGMIPTQGAWQNLFAGVADDAKSLDLGQWIPQMRLGEALELAKAIEFLISDESSYFNGQEIQMDGAMHLASGAGPFYSAFRKFSDQQWQFIKAMTTQKKS